MQLPPSVAVNLATGLGVAAAVGPRNSAPAYAAYSVTRHDNGTLTVSVSRASGVPGANATLRKIRARVRVVPVRSGCPPIESLPRPHPAPHPSVSVRTEMTRNGHRSVMVRLGKGGIPRGDTMILAFSGDPHTGTALGAGGIITGRVPRCVSLPSAPHGAGRSGSASTVAQIASARGLGPRWRGDDRAGSR